MLSFHADPAIKARYLARVEGHAAADEIIKGQDWEAGKGCAVGCTVHGASHDDFERELGIPRMLAWLEDVIFEGLPNWLAKTWPERFLASIAPGKDLGRIGWQLLHWLLTESGFGEPDHPTVRDAVRQCSNLLAQLIERQPIAKATADDAAGIAWAAARRAASISEPAAWVAEAAARAAESMALSVQSAAASAERAAMSVTAAIARSADYIAVSEKLLALLEAA